MSDDKKQKHRREKSMSPKYRCENIDVKNIDIESKISMFSMFPMLMSKYKDRVYVHVCSNYCNS